MAKAAASDAIMTAEKMKPLLGLSKKEPVQAAIGLTGEGEAVMLLDKKAKPKKVLSMLRASAAKAKLSLGSASLRFGRAEVDPEYDSAIVRLSVNKEPPGNMRVKLTELVKRIPYQKVEFIVDPSLEDEGEEDEAAAAAPAAAAPVPPAPPPPPTPSAAQLTQALAQLIGRIPAASGGDAARRSQLAQLAGAANGLLKSGNLAGAQKAIVGLGQAIAAAAAPAPGVDAAALLALFRDAKEEVDSGIEKLQAELRASEDVDLIRIADFGLYGMTNGEGVGLMKALLDLRAAAPDRQGPLLQAAREAAGAYKEAVFAHPLADLADDNPFGVEVGIKARLGPALDRIAAA
jgi:hypothetical protein